MAINLRLEKKLVLPAFVLALILGALGVSILHSLGASPDLHAASAKLKAESSSHLQSDLTSPTRLIAQQSSTCYTPTHFCTISTPGIVGTRCFCPSPHGPEEGALR